MISNPIEKRVSKLEQRAGTKTAPSAIFRFLDNPDGVAECQRAHPEALIIHRIIVSPGQTA